MELNEKAKEAREKLKQILNANPTLKKAFNEALDETKKHFENPDTIKEIATTISKTKSAFESGKFNETVENFKKEQGLSGNTKLTDELKRKLAQELADGILGK